MSDTTLRDRTAHHYDDHPFDAITAEDERQPRNIQPKAFIEFCEQYSQKQMAVAEVRCGAGRGTMFLRASGADVMAVDISAVSPARARRRVSGARLVRATTMELPL